ncbi:MAG: hypothetical protein HC834_03100 [Rhodospirillales bacterium]|nr:hypothetical protein [Rhodospirillales bacterium]
MGDLTRLKTDIERLAPTEFAELRDWLLAVDHDAWDRQIEADSASGKLDAFIAEARADASASRTRDL